MPSWFELSVVAHIACAVLGFGGSLLTRVQPAGAAGHAVSGGGDEPASLGVVRVPGPALLVDVATYGVAVFGLLAVWAGNWPWDADWITMAFVLYVGWLGVHHGLIRRLHGRAATAQVRTQLLAGSWVSAVLLVAALVVMVAKPSF